ncbi:SH3 domain [Trinorchestia longiramus]|nr:SH3 domain [Trinorchestia longiramus]
MTWCNTTTPDHDIVMVRVLSVALAEEVTRPLRQLLDTQHKVRKGVEGMVDKTTRNVHEWRTAEYKAKKQSHSACRENEKIQDMALEARLGRGKTLSEKETAKMEKQRRKAEELVQRSEAEYYTCAVRAERARLEWESAIYKGTTCFQTLEEERLAALKQLVEKYQDNIKIAAPKMAESASRLEEPVSQCDVEKDVATIINAKGTGENIPHQLLPDFYAEDINNIMNRERRRESLEKLNKSFKSDIERERRGKQGVENLAKALQETPNFGGEDSQQDVNDKLQHMRAMLAYLEAARHKIQCSLAELEHTPRPSHPVERHVHTSRDKQGMMVSILKNCETETRLEVSAGDEGQRSTESNACSDAATSAQLDSSQPTAIGDVPDVVPKAAVRKSKLAKRSVVTNVVYVSIGNTPDSVSRHNAAEKIVVSSDGTLKSTQTTSAISGSIHTALPSPSSRSGTLTSNKSLSNSSGPDSGPSSLFPSSFCAETNPRAPVGMLLREFLPRIRYPSLPIIPPDEFSSQGSDREYQNAITSIGADVAHNNIVNQQSNRTDCDQITNYVNHTATAAEVTEAVTKVAAARTTEAEQTSEEQNPIAAIGFYATQPPPNDAVEAMGRCKALYDYDANMYDELTIRTGDIIQLHRKQPDGWWVAPSFSSSQLSAVSPDEKPDTVSSTNLLATVSGPYSSSEAASSKTLTVKRLDSPDDKNSLANSKKDKTSDSASRDISAEHRNGNNFVSVTGTLSPSPDSLNADNLSSTSRDSCTGSHSDSFKSCVSSGYDSCNSAAAVGATVEPCSSKTPPDTNNTSSLTREQGPLETKETEVSLDKGRNKQQVSQSINLDGESPPPLPSSPPPDNLPSSDVPPFYVPPSGLPPPLFQKCKNISNATPLIKKLTEVLSASTSYLTDETINYESSLSSSFENLEEEEEEEHTVQASFSKSAMLSTSTPNLSPLNAPRHQNAARHLQRLSLNSTISEEDSDNNDAADKCRPQLTPGPKKVPPEFMPVARERKKSPRAKKETPPIPPRVVNISGPTNVSLPASVDLTSSIYKPIQKPLIAPNRSQSQSPNKMAFIDPYITESNLNRDSSPFSRFLPHLGSTNYDRTKNFMRRSLKSPSLTSLRQSTRSITSSALQTLRKSSRHLKSSLMASLNKAVSMDELDSPDSPRARAQAIHISAPCVPKPIGTFAYCPPSSIENVTLKSTKNKKKFSSLQQISKTERREVDSGCLFSSNSPTTSEPSFENENFAKLMSFKAVDDFTLKKSNKGTRKISLPNFHLSMGSLGVSAGLPQNHAANQPAISQDSLNDLHVFSENEINDITKSISRSLSTEVIGPKLPKPGKPSSNYPTLPIELGQTGKLSEEPEIVFKSDEGLSGRIVENLTATQDLEVSSQRHKTKSNEPSASAPLRKKKSSKCKSKKTDSKNSVKMESKNFVCNESFKIHRSSLPDEPSFPAPLTVPCKLTDVDSKVDEERQTSNKLSAKPKPLLGLPIDERQMQLQQQLLQCLKIRLDEYNTNGSVSPLPPSLSAVNIDFRQSSNSSEGENDTNAKICSQSENDEKFKQNERLRGVVLLEHTEEELDVKSQEERKEKGQEQEKSSTLDNEDLQINLKQNEEIEKMKVKHLIENLETESLETEELDSDEQSKVMEFDVKRKRMRPAHVTLAAKIQENTAKEQEDDVSDSDDSLLKQYTAAESNEKGVTPLSKKEKSQTHPKNSETVVETNGDVTSENQEDKKRRELKRLLEEKNHSLQLLHEKQEKELALRREKQELDKNQKLLEETLKRQELERVKLESAQNLSYSKEMTAEKAKKLYLRKLLDEHQQNDCEQKSKEHYPLHQLGNDSVQTSAQMSLNAKIPCSSESKNVDRCTDEAFDNGCQSQTQSNTKFETIAPVKNIKQQLMYHIEQRKLQQKQLKTKQESPELTEKKAAETSVRVDTLLGQDAEELRLPAWDDEETCDIVDTNISDFIGNELIAETEGHYDEQPGSLTLLPPPASFCDSTFSDCAAVEKDVAAVNTLKDSNEMLSEDNFAVPPLNFATRPSLKTQKTKNNKRVTFGVNETEINYYHQNAKDEAVVQKTITHPEFNAFALRRPKSKSRRNGSLTSSSEVKDFYSVSDSPVIYENFPPHESSDDKKSNPPPLPRKNSRVGRNSLTRQGASQSPASESGGTLLPNNQEKPSVSDSDDAESYA